MTEKPQRRTAFLPGDTAFLNSGGPLMTIGAATTLPDTDTISYSTFWFCGGQVCVGVFTADMLTANEAMPTFH